jgi:hypothetical protein
VTRAKATKSPLLTSHPGRGIGTYAVTPRAACDGSPVQSPPAGQALTAPCTCEASEDVMGSDTIFVFNNRKGPNQYGFVPVRSSAALPQDGVWEEVVGPTFVSRCGFHDLIQEGIRTRGFCVIDFRAWPRGH